VRPFEFLNSLMNYADSDLVFCRKEGRLVYRTRKAEGVRESFSGVKDVLGQVAIFVGFSSTAQSGSMSR
jgi:hypothetical protein